MLQCLLIQWIICDLWEGISRLTKCFVYAALYYAMDNKCNIQEKDYQNTVFIQDYANMLVFVHANRIVRPDVIGLHEVVLWSFIIIRNMAKNPLKSLFSTDLVTVLLFYHAKSTGVVISGNPRFELQKVILFYS